VKRPLPLAARLTLSFILVAALFSATLAVVLELIIDRQFLATSKKSVKRSTGKSSATSSRSMPRTARGAQIPERRSPNRP